MKKVIIIIFVLFSLASWGSSSNAHKPTSAESHRLSKDRHEDQKDRKDLHSHDLKPKSKYDLRNVDGHRGGDSPGHTHRYKHDQKAKSPLHLRHIHKHDRREGHGHAHKHNKGDAHKHKHSAAHGHDHGDTPRTHDDHSHKGHGHDHGHGGHDHGYDRVWHVGISG